jgi:hypothetical protein
LSSTRIAAAALALIAGLLGDIADVRAAEDLARAPYSEPRLAALILDLSVAEISGLAASRRHDDVLWVHNDSDAKPSVIALNTRGEVIGSVRVRGVVNTDWEDLASFELDGKPYLAIADSGDNGGLRREIAVIVIPEPEPQAKSVTPAWIARIRWPDGPRDCEAMAVDARAREILLLAKKRVPAQLFRVPLAPTSSAQLLVAEQIASISHIPQPTPEDIAVNPRMGRFMGQITAMDLSADGTRLALLTYRDGYEFVRTAGTSWRDVLGNPPMRLGLPPLPQGESLAYSRDGQSIWASSERLPAPLVQLGPPP